MKPTAALAYLAGTLAYRQRKRVRASTSATPNPTCPELLEEAQRRAAELEMLAVALFTAWDDQKPIGPHLVRLRAAVLR